MNFNVNLCWLARVNPPLKIIVSIVYSFIIALSYEISTLVFSFFFTLILAFSTNVKFKIIMRRLIPVLLFLLFFLFSFHIKFDFFYITFVSLSESKKILSLCIFLKTITLAIFFVIFINTTLLNVLVGTLSLMRVPKKIVFLMLISFRYVFLIEEEYNKLFSAIVIRGFTPKINFHTYRTYSYLLGMLLVKSYERSRKVYNAMICRSFNGYFFTLDKYYFNKESLVFIFFFAFFVLMIFFF